MTFTFYIDWHWVIDYNCKPFAQTFYSLSCFWPIDSSKRHTYCRNSIGDVEVICIWADLILHWWYDTKWMLNAPCTIVEEVILSLIIIDFVNNYIYLLLISTFGDSHWFHEVLTHCKHILVFFVLSRKQVHHQWSYPFDYLFLGSNLWKGLP